MFRKLLICFIILGLVLGVIQLTRAVFTNTIDGGLLTVGSLVLGVTVAALFGFVLDHPNYPMVAIFTIFASVLIVATLNSKLAKTHIYSKSYEVIGFGSKVVRHSKFSYVKLSGKCGDTRYSVPSKEATSYSVGDRVTVRMKDGFWGFPIIVALKNRASNKTLQTDGTTLCTLCAALELNRKLYEVYNISHINSDFRVLYIQ